MARALRIQFEGAIYHVTSRGNERRNIFRTDRDRQRFLEILAENVEGHHIRLYAYVLMSNHFHLLIETPRANLCAFMQQFNSAYTTWFNTKHKRSGHLYGKEWGYPIKYEMSDCHYCVGLVRVRAWQGKRACSIRGRCTMCTTGAWTGGTCFGMIGTGRTSWTVWRWASSGFTPRSMPTA